ncbi:hypothetical protein D3C85_749300 [compost metagenome]
MRDGKNRRQFSIRAAQLYLHFVGTDGLDLGELRRQRQDLGTGDWILVPQQRKHHVGCGQSLAIVEGHFLAQGDHPERGVSGFDALGQLQLRHHMVVETRQAVVEHVMTHVVGGR